MTVTQDVMSQWSSIAPNRTIRLARSPVDVDMDRLSYHMELDLVTALPEEIMDRNCKVKPDTYLCLSWPFGGLWKIERVSKDRKKVWCLSWRKAHVTPQQMNLHRLEVNALSTGRGLEEEGGVTRRGRSPTATAQAQAPGVPTLFKWKMVHGNWGTDAHHWFLHTLEPPSPTEPHQSRLLVKIFTGFAALEAQVEVHAVTAIDTVAQTYAADVTWQATLPAVTTVPNFAMLREFLEMLEIDMAQFEFSNVTELKQQHELSTSVTAAGTVCFHDNVPAGTPWGHTRREPVFHLQFSRRVVAQFTDEMTLHTFPFDQQRLTFELTTGATGLPDGPLRLIPTPAKAGSLVVDNFHLGNVFTLAFHDKVFVDNVTAEGPCKTVAFQVVLERKGMYYVTNVALIATMITYLCFFVSWAPADKQGNPMDTGSRLQNATAMVLAAVMFKNQVSSLVPQISYFTILDSYVSVCFVVTCFVTLESALYPLVESWFEASYRETTLLGYALLLFTVVNVGWGASLVHWIYYRRHAATPVMQACEYISTIVNVVPASDRLEVVNEFLTDQKIRKWCRPQLFETRTGEVHVQAPDDIPQGAFITHCIARSVRRRTAERKEARESLVVRQRKTAENAVAEIRAVHQRLQLRAVRDPSQPSPSPRQHQPQPRSDSLPAAKTTDAAYQAGARQLARMASSIPGLDSAEDQDGLEPSARVEGARTRLRSLVQAHIAV